MKKEPPDVIVFNTKTKEYNHWFCLLEWAYNNKDVYLFNRALEFIDSIL